MLSNEDISDEYSDESFSEKKSKKSLFSWRKSKKNKKSRAKSNAIDIDIEDDDKPIFKKILQKFTQKTQFIHNNVFNVFLFIFILVIDFALRFFTLPFLFDEILIDKDKRFDAKKLIGFYSLLIFTIQLIFLFSSKLKYGIILVLTILIIAQITYIYYVYLQLYDLGSDFIKMLFIIGDFAICIPKALILVSITFEQSRWFR